MNIKVVRLQIPARSISALALHTSLDHREMCKVLGSLSGSPPLSMQPQLWIQSGQWLCERMLRRLCSYGQISVLSQMFSHYTILTLYNMSFGYLTCSNADVCRGSQPNSEAKLMGKKCSTTVCANFAPLDRDTSSTLYARSSGSGFLVLS